jgi:hypothetical protein
MAQRGRPEDRAADDQEVQALDPQEGGVGFYHGASSLPFNTVGYAGTVVSDPSFRWQNFLASSLEQSTAPTLNTESGLLELADVATHAPLGQWRGGCRAVAGGLGSE